MKSLIFSILVISATFSGAAWAQAVPELNVMKTATIRGTGDCDRNGAFVPLHLGEKTHDLLLFSPNCEQIWITTAGWGSSGMSLMRQANGKNLADLNLLQAFKEFASGSGRLTNVVRPVEGDTYVLLLNSGVVQGLVVFKIIKVTENSVDVDYVVRNYSYGFDNRYTSSSK